MQYLIDFINTATEAEITQYFTDNGCTVVKEWDNFEKAFLVDANSVPVKTSIVERVIEENSVAITPHDVIQVDPQHGCHGHNDYPTISVSTTDEKDWWKNFSYVQPKFDEKPLTLSRLGESITVYLMDSGIEDTHPEFTGRNITKLYSVIPGDFTDRAGHGTSLASLIVGNTCGITNAKLKVVKIFDTNHATLQSEFLDALDAIINDHVDNTFAVLNASWSIPKNEWVEHKISLAVQEGIFVIAAAGNTGVSIEDVTPASMWEVLTVGAYNNELQPCDFSNYTGPASTGQGTVNHGELDGWAPGEQIWVAGINNSYGFMSGTSAAAAISSAIVASNLEFHTDEEGNKEFYIQQLMLNTTSNTAVHENTVLFGRYDMLEYNDPKYNDSINRIATIADRCLRVKPQPSDEISLMVRVGDNLSPLIYSPSLTKTIEPLDPMPPNFYLNNWGDSIKPTAVDNGPTENEHYKLYTLRFNRTGLDDISELLTVYIYVLAADKNTEDFPENDPIIPIVLLASCVGGGRGCNPGSAFQCVDSCYPTYFYGCCAAYKEPDIQCRCDPG